MDHSNRDFYSYHYEWYHHLISISSGCFFFATTLHVIKLALYDVHCWCWTACRTILTLFPNGGSNGRVANKWLLFQFIIQGTHVVQSFKNHHEIQKMCKLSFTCVNEIQCKFLKNYTCKRSGFHTLQACTYFFAPPTWRLFTQYSGIFFLLPATTHATVIILIPFPRITLQPKIANFTR